MPFVLARGHAAVRCRGVSTALVTSTTPPDNCVETLRPRGYQSAPVRQWTGGAVAEALGCQSHTTTSILAALQRGFKWRQQDVLSHGESGNQARVVTCEGIEFIAVALEDEGALGKADADLVLVQETDA
ncbi:hypothetical protein ACSSS7_007911 [Eimeria intestinalis]